MGPKVEAACRFAAAGTGAMAAIGRLEDAGQLLAGQAGTVVTNTVMPGDRA
jgi:carbamate kinase